MLGLSFVLRMLQGVQPCLTWHVLRVTCSWQSYRHCICTGFCQDQEWHCCKRQALHTFFQQMLCVFSQSDRVSHRHLMECAACRGYDRAAFKLRGADASLNFPDTDYSQDWFYKVCAPCWLPHCWFFSCMLLFYDRSSFLTCSATQLASVLVGFTCIEHLEHSVEQLVQLGLYNCHIGSSFCRLLATWMAETMLAGSGNGHRCAASWNKLCRS